MLRRRPGRTRPSRRPPSGGRPATGTGRSARSPGTSYSSARAAFFDYLTFFTPLYVFGCWNPADASLFRTGWFAEPLPTRTPILHVIRTNRLPFLRSRASRPLVATTVAVMAVGASLPFSPVGPPLGFTPLPLLDWPLLAPTLFGYVVLTQVVKGWLLRKVWVSG